MINKEKKDKLAETARLARKKALAFKSKHGIGAAVITNEGEIFEGCNIDGVISSQGICAEMAAINHALVHGKRQIEAVCVADDKITYPCGVCLQYMKQIGQITGVEMEILAVDMEGNCESRSLKELLPEGYESKTFGEILKEYAK